MVLRGHHDTLRRYDRDRGYRYLYRRPETPGSSCRTYTYANTLGGNDNGNRNPHSGNPHYRDLHSRYREVRYVHGDSLSKGLGYGGRFGGNSLCSRCSYRGTCLKEVGTLFYVVYNITSFWSHAFLEVLFCSWKVLIELSNQLTVAKLHLRLVGAPLVLKFKTFCTPPFMVFLRCPVSRRILGICLCLSII